MKYIRQPKDSMIKVGDFFTMNGEYDKIRYEILKIDNKNILEFCVYRKGIREEPLTDEYGFKQLFVNMDYCLVKTTWRGRLE